MKQHIDLSSSRLATYKALRDEIVNHGRARRTWTDPNAMQVDAVHINHGQTRAKVEGRQGQGNRSASLKVNAGTARRRDTKRRSAERCRQISLQAKCDKNGKPTGVNAHVDRRDACSSWSLCTSRIPLAVRRLSRQKPGSST